ncbi:MAG: hypothetical protein JNL38_29490 [Myxococcales bacterium]|jgi:hypothetical protein|nr:hypothetical protein [Myxococcales bacterium]
MRHIPTALFGATSSDGRRALQVAALAAVLASGCRGKVDDRSETSEAPSAPSPVTTLPQDAVGKGQLIEGKEEAYGVRLPYEWSISSKMQNGVVAVGPGKPEDVANYVRARVQAKTVNVGASSTRFVKVTVRSLPNRELAIGVEPDPRGGARSRIVIEDVTPPPDPPPEKRDPAARMESVGLTPNGRVLNPSRLE